MGGGASRRAQAPSVVVHAAVVEDEDDEELSAAEVRTCTRRRPFCNEASSRSAPKMPAATVHLCSPA